MSSAGRCPAPIEDAADLAFAAYRSPDAGLACLARAVWFRSPFLDPHKSGFHQVSAREETRHSLAGVARSAERVASGPVAVAEPGIPGAP